jgi:glycosyltransferase involved in cell wall biosynthesis
LGAVANSLLAAKILSTSDISIQNNFLFLKDMNVVKSFFSNEGPVVSIGLPVYNGENYVSEAIDCVLEQTFDDWELIISDNASTDRTIAICRSYANRDNRIRLYEQPQNRGYSPNYNEVFQLSRGRYFKWMAHDDLFGKEFLEVCLNELRCDEQTVLVFPVLTYIDADGRPLRKQSSDLSILGSTAESRFIQFMELASKSPDIFWCLYGLIRRDILEKTGLMGLYGGDDQVCLLKIALQGKIKQIHCDLFFRREHPGAATMRRGWTAKERAALAYAGDRRKVVLPYWRLAKEYLACLWQSSIPARVKTKCMCAVVRRFRPQWKEFPLELITSPLDAIRRR